MVLHVLHPGARLMVVAECPIDETALQTALHAGACYLVEWTTPADQVCAVARAAYGLGRYMPSGPMFEAIIDLLDRPGARSAGLRFGSLWLDMAMRRVHLDGRRLPLTALEFEVLAYLARHAGRVVSSAELLREVWRCSTDGGGSKDQLKSAIKRLRRKIEPDPQCPRYLLTVRGHGYVMPSQAEWKRISTYHRQPPQEI
jgi:DNA-binding response OmpR family regulator